MRNPDIRGYENWDFQSSETDSELVAVNGSSSVCPVIFHPVSTQIMHQKIISVQKAQGFCLTILFA